MVYNPYVAERGGRHGGALIVLLLRRVYMPEIPKSSIGISHGNGKLKKAAPKYRPPRNDEWGRKMHNLNLYRMSDEWMERCELVKARDNHQCVICASMENIEVHHLTYCDVFHEPLHHLVTVCQKCHTGKSGSIHYDENGKRRKNWKKYNPKPVLPKGEK